MKLQDFSQQFAVNPNDADRLVQAWFGPDDIIVLSGKRVNRLADTGNVFSQCLTAREFVNALKTPEGLSIFESLSFLPEPLDVYINVGTPREELKSVLHRVKEVDLDRVIGIIGDFDVKDGSFRDTQHIYDYLNSLAIRPTIVVESGSGGVHAWWKFRETNVTVAQGKDIAARWWTYLHEIASTKFNAQVDKLVDTARMLRLPGTVHWPKPKDLDGSPTPVLLVDAWDITTPLSTFIKVSESSWSNRLRKVASTRKTDQTMRVSGGDFSHLLKGGDWEQLLAVSNVEEFFSETVSWENVLRPAGWTYTRTDSAGREEWARPGRDGEKSACVNWPESPDIMSLLSTAHDTNLLDLLDAEIPLTKWRVSLRLNFGDNYQAMVNWTLDLMKRTK